MQISLRSPLAAGTAAALTASAIAISPVLTQDALKLSAVQMPTASFQVALAVFHNPVSQLIQTLGVTNAYLFSPQPWQTYTPWSDLSALGVVPQIINDHLPIISQLGQNGADYLYQTVRGIGTSAYLVSEGVWNAAADLLALDIPGAISTLLTAVQNAGQVTLDTGKYVLTGVVTRATAVFNAIAGLLPIVPSAVVGQVSVLVGSVVKVVTDAVAALGSANPLQNTWNAVVDGLLGPTGIPGGLNALTIGAGVDPVPPQIPVYVPSIRVLLTTVVANVTSALATSNPAPVPVAARRSSAPRPAAATGATSTDDPAAIVSASSGADTKSGGKRRGGAGRAGLG